MTSKNMTKSSTRTIWMRNFSSRFLTASTSAWTQAKLPMIRRSRKNQSSTPVAFGTWSVPARSASTCDRVGISVNVKIVASSAHQKISITNASHGMPGRKYWSDIRPVTAIGRVTSWRAAPKRSVTEVAQRGEPADHHRADPDQTDPEHPDRTGRVPPRHQEGRDEVDPP